MSSPPCPACPLCPQSPRIPYRGWQQSGFEKTRSCTRTECQLLAERSLPIILKPIEKCAAPHGQPQEKPEGSAAAPGCVLPPQPKKVQRFELTRATADSQVLQEQLGAGARQNLELSQDGFHRLAGLHQALRLQGHCPDLSMIANMYAPQSLHAALDWVDAHPEWSAPLKYRSALEFVSCFQNKLAQLSPLP
jgi:hypothetical protein